MTPPAEGIAVVLVAGVLAVLLAWWLDRRRAAQVRAAETAPPDRPIPGLQATNGPQYVTEGALAATPVSVVGDDREAALLSRRAEAPGVPAGVPDGRFLNRPRVGLAIAVEPQVLVCAGPVRTQRDVVTVLRAGRRRERPLVWVAAEFSAEVLGTLRANALAGTAVVLPIEVADDLQRRRACALSGARVVSAADLAADHLPEDSWGGCAAWIADLDDSWIIADEAIDDLGQRP